MTSDARPAGPERPPQPPHRPQVLRAHDDERVDPWLWLRDHDDPAVLAHLAEENAYTEGRLAHLAPLRAALFTEIRARIVETDLSVPVRHGPWWYYQRTIEGSGYPVHCRRPARGDEPPPVEPGPAAEEQVLLDQNVLAEGNDFLHVANLEVSPDHAWLAYAVDTTGDERFELHFVHLGETGSPAGAPSVRATETVPDTSYGLAWASDGVTVFYTRVDDAMRPYQVWRHRLGSDPGQDVLVLQEEDRHFTVEPWRTRDGAFVVLSARSTTSAESWVVAADDPSRAPHRVLRRRPEVEYEVDHWPGPEGGWFLAVTNDGARDFRVVAAPDATVLAGDGSSGPWTEVLPHRPGTRVGGVDAFRHWLVVSERHDGEARLRVAPVGPGPSDPPGPDLGPRSWLVPADEHPSTTWDGPNPEVDSRWLRYEQTSLVSPRTVVDLDLERRSPVVRKRQPVRRYRTDRYRTFRLHARADDGVEIPISVVHRAELVTDQGAGAGSPPDRPAPCVLYGYGAYEHSIDPVFSPLRLPLLDRGAVFAIAHVRGGGELGRRWYEDGKLAAKEHTFTDFVACARHLVDAGFTTPDRLAARGASAGGLLVGAVANLAPELFRAMVAEVPFVDCLTTMLDDTLPLTVGEWEEWGNPVADPSAYRAMRSYSPYDNVRSRDPDGNPVRYPAVLATAGLHDTRVGYWEPAKWVAKLRDANPDNRALLWVELGAGHGGPSGRYEAWREEARVLAFLLEELGLATVEPLDAVAGGRPGPLAGEPGDDDAAGVSPRPA